MRVLVWITEGTWPATVDAARAHTPDRAGVTLLHVTGTEVAATAHGAFAGLLGRAHPSGRRASDGRPAEGPDAHGWGSDPAAAVDRVAAATAQELLAAATERLARPCTAVERTGRVEREVVAAADGFDLLVLARDGDRSRLGPHSLGPATRFVVDHAPCPVLLVWPGPPPPTATIPPPPGH